ASAAFQLAPRPQHRTLRRLDMINLDNPFIAGMLVTSIALIVPIIYSFFVDNHKKGSPDPRKNSF
ncbi:MAG TPA: hypothetical protein VKA31_02275, partial [Mariprofundaceae bacterium]|nr:hypothetical protein [Mariprofundaceae bacterium]